MAEVSTIDLDIAKAVFHAHGADARGQMVFSRRLTRAKLLDFFAEQPRCIVALEAYGGAHHWAREIASLGHEVKLIPPAYVKPFVKRNKNDAVDAEAICEAAQRPSMRYAASPQSCETAAAPARDSLTATGTLAGSTADEGDAGNRLRKVRLSQPQRRQHKKSPK